MKEKIMAKNIVEACIACDIKLATENFIVEQNDNITNDVREKIDLLPKEKQEDIQRFFYHLLNVSYGFKLYPEEPQDQDCYVVGLKEKEMFLLRETVIYFLGRLSILPDINILKKIYEIDENKYAKLNLVFSSLPTFAEDLEMDFINRFAPNNEYDIMLRSWTMAYFKCADNPYQYIDSPTDDWEPAKVPRIKRLGINDENNPKYLKAMSFRLLDLFVLNLFLESREKESLTSEEKQIIESSYIDYYKFSNAKKEKLKELKQRILKK